MDNYINDKLDRFDSSDDIKTVNRYVMNVMDTDGTLEDIIVGVDNIRKYLNNVRKFQPKRGYRRNKRDSC